MIGVGMADRAYHLNVLPERRQLTIYPSGSAMVRTVRMVAGSARAGAGHAQLDEENARHLVDAMAAATGYYPCQPDLDQERARIRVLADELRDRRDAAGTDAELAELAELALSRHVGHQLADAAELIHEGGDHLDDRTVAEMMAELAGLVDTILFATERTNPERRRRAHLDRIELLRERLPKPGTDTPKEQNP